MYMYYTCCIMSTFYILNATDSYRSSVAQSRRFDTNLEIWNWFPLTHSILFCSVLFNKNLPEEQRYI